MIDRELIGRLFAGRFMIEAMVGEGAMGCVYRARQVSLGTTVAVKLLHAELSEDETFKKRFLREAETALLVNHPGSRRIIDFGEHKGRLYIAMEYVDGRTLGALLEDEGSLPVPRIVAIASQILAALGAAHDAGVLHRDLKPENVMVEERRGDDGCVRDIVKVCDFGVAKLIDDGASRVTAEGTLVGTPAYMSPEQARGEKLDVRSDVYAMGVLLFQLMTGRLPFESPTPLGTALMHVTMEPTSPRSINPSADAGLEAICLKAMRKRREDRYSSAHELRAELLALTFAAPAASIPPSAAIPSVALMASAVTRNHVETVAELPPPGLLLRQVEVPARRTGYFAAAAVLVGSLAAVIFVIRAPPAPPSSEAPSPVTLMTARVPVPHASGASVGAASATAHGDTAPNAEDADRKATSGADRRARARASAPARARSGPRKGGAPLPASSDVDVPVSEAGPASETSSPVPAAPAAKGTPGVSPVSLPQAAAAAPAAQPPPLPEFPVPKAEPAAPAATPAPASAPAPVPAAGGAAPP